MVGAPSDDSKVDLLKRCIRNMKFTSYGKKSVDVRSIFNLKKLLAFCTKQFEWHHPAQKIIEPASSDIDSTFYLQHKQCGTGWIKRDSDTSSGFSLTLLFA